MDSMSKMYFRSDGAQITLRRMKPSKPAKRKNPFAADLAAIKDTNS